MRDGLSLGCFLTLEKNARNGSRTAAARGGGVDRQEAVTSDRGARRAAGMCGRVVMLPGPRPQSVGSSMKSGMGGNRAAADELYARNYANCDRYNPY